jgi:hypothetical protein
VEALVARRAGKEIISDYASNSNPGSSHYSDFSYEFYFGSDPDEPESEKLTTEQLLSGPATGLVITSTPAGRFVYWPDHKPTDLTDGNSRYVAYLDSLPSRRSILQPRWRVQTLASVPLIAKSSWLLARCQDLQVPGPITTSKTYPQTMHPPMKPTTTRMPDVSAT